MHTQNPNTVVGVPSPTQIGPQCKFHFFCPLHPLYYFIIFLFYLSLAYFSLGSPPLKYIYLALKKLVKTKIVLWEITLEINIVILLLSFVIMKWFQLVFITHFYMPEDGFLNSSSISLHPRSVSSKGALLGCVTVLPTLEIVSLGRCGGGSRWGQCSTLFHCSSSNRVHQVPSLLTLQYAGSQIQ